MLLLPPEVTVDVCEVLVALPVPELPVLVPTPVVVVVVGDGPPDDPLLVELVEAMLETPSLATILYT